MSVRHFSEEESCCTDTDEDGPCVITWTIGDAPPRPAEDATRCDGWINSVIPLAPNDGQARPGTNIVNGTLQAEAEWYEVSTGFPGVIFGEMVAIPPFFHDPIEDEYEREGGAQWLSDAKQPAGVWGALRVLGPQGQNDPVQAGAGKDGTR